MLSFFLWFPVLDLASLIELIEGQNVAAISKHLNWSEGAEMKGMDDQPTC